MWVGYIKDRQELGFNCVKDIESVKQLLNFTSTLNNSRVYITKKSSNTFIFIFSKETVVAILIFIGSMDLKPSIENPSLFSSLQISQSRLMKSNIPEFSTSFSQVQDSILKPRGGSENLSIEQQDNLIKSILAKVPKSGYHQVSINKFLKGILKLIDPVISDERVWRILAELEKPNKFTMIQSTNELTHLNYPKRSERVIDDFESRVAKQKLSNENDSKLLRMHARHEKKVKQFDKMRQFLNRHRSGPSHDVNSYLSKSGLPHKKSVSARKQETFDSNVNSLNRSEGRSPLFGTRRKVIISAAPSSSESNITPTTPSPTPNLFSADQTTGEIQNINIAFNQFKQRMIKIGNQYTGQKHEYFFKQLNQCEIDRFKALSTEKGKITIYNVREAEVMLQSEFEGFHEPNSITRPNESEVQANNRLDARFRKGLLSGESNTLNKQYTDVDVKVLVSDETLQFQADQRRILGHRNPNKMSMYEQGKKMGASIVAQKYKHCDPNKPELPSLPENVEHIISSLELMPSETRISKAGVIDGARMAWAMKLDVPESSISDQTALQGIIFINEDYTIERVN